LRSLVLRPSSLVYGILLLAFLARAYRLADQNVWWDEGWSIWLSQKDLVWIAWRTAMDEHPPLHYWMLHFWNFIAGTSAFAGRFLSLAFGVLTVALIYRIGKRVGGVWIGVLAALFLATARFHIWWSQDIKNYTPSIFFAFAAVWFALEVSGFRFQVSSSAVSGQRSAVSDQRSAVSFSSFVLRPSSLAYALCAALALWTHYLAALVIIALNIYVILVTLYESRSVLSFQFSVSSGQPSAVSSQSSVFFHLAHWLIGSLAHWLIGSLPTRLPPRSSRLGCMCICKTPQNGLPHPHSILFFSSNSLPQSCHSALRRTLTIMRC
ncbi:MAG: glycosyltransferase family 39 protein, partial [Anaerolineae bacterium]|nr:glycosyltransferase family 39 protein [Anaerolineae bacterium]